jgi:aspartate aminotransferase-like enzyme
VGAGSSIPLPSSARSARHAYDIVTIVHGETSTGVRNPIDQVAGLVQAHGALLLSR